MNDILTGKTKQGSSAWRKTYIHLAELTGREYFILAIAASIQLPKEED